MSKNNKGKDYSLPIVAIVAIVALTICFLAKNDFNFSGTMDKEKIEVTAYNSNLENNSEGF